MSHQPMTRVTLPSGAYNGVEHRSKDRIYQPYSATVQGTDADGVSFSNNVVLLNMSVCGLFFKLPRRVEKEARLSVVVNLLIDPAAAETGVCIGLHGVVMRVDPKVNDSYGVAVAYTHYWYL